MKNNNVQYWATAPHLGDIDNNMKGVDFDICI